MALIAAAVAAGAGMAAAGRSVSARAYGGDGITSDRYGREKEHFEPHPKYRFKERDRLRGNQKDPYRRLGRLTQAAQFLEYNLEVTPALAAQMAQRLRSFVIGIEGDDRGGVHTMRWSRKLVKGLAKVPELREGLLSRGVIKTLTMLDESKNDMLDHVVTLETSHRDVRDGKEVDMEAYSQSAAVMGDRWWMQKLFGDIANRIDQFYLLRPNAREIGYVNWVYDPDTLMGGWRRYKFANKVYYWNPETKKMQSRLPAHVVSDAPPPPLDPPVALLDIGSCHNSLAKYPWLDITAIDLEPAPGATDVFKADFFVVPIVDEHYEGSVGTGAASAAVGDEAPAAERSVEDSTGDVSSKADKRGVSQDGRVQLDANGQLIGLRAGSFNVAVISLVLSFLPNAQKRSEMISRARRCLSDDRGMLIVADVPGLLATGSWYNDDAAQVWTRAIEGLGFKCKHFSSTIKKRDQVQPCNLWIFETAPIPEQPPTETLTSAKEMG